MQILVINKVSVLGRGLHIPTQIFLGVPLGGVAVKTSV